MFDQTEIDVRYEADHEVPLMHNGTPMLTWLHHPIHGDGWTLWYLDDPESESAGVEEYFIPGDLADVDEVVGSARKWLSHIRG